MIALDIFRSSHHVQHSLNLPCRPLAFQDKQIYSTNFLVNKKSIIKTGFNVQHAQVVKSQYHVTRVLLRTEVGSMPKIVDPEA
jgi:hypothetical protein